MFFFIKQLFTENKTQYVFISPIEYILTDNEYLLKYDYEHVNILYPFAMLLTPLCVLLFMQIVLFSDAVRRITNVEYVQPIFLFLLK